MSVWRDLIGTVETVFKIGLNKASLDAGALTAPRTFTLPDVAGSIALLDSPALTGNPTAPTAAQFDNDTSIATTAYAMSIGMRSNGQGAYTSTATMSAADVGRTAYFSHATIPGTLTLPVGTPFPVGSLISISCANAAPVTVTRAGASLIFAMGGLLGFGSVSIVLQLGDFVTLYWSGGNWIQVASSRCVDEHAAIATNATTPNPGTAGRKIWSTTELKTLTWNGTLWEAPASGGSGAPGGTTTQVQYNNAGAFAGAANVSIVGGNLNLGNATPTAAPANTGTLFMKLLGGRSMLAVMGPSGLDVSMQPSMARNDVGYWRPAGNSTVVPGVMGYTAPTVVGTATARNVATTNFFTRLCRLGYVSVATAAAFASSRAATAQVTIGAGSGIGGFLKVVRFGISDAAAVAGARMFVGVSSSTAAPTNVEPSTLTNSIGVGHGAADTNLQIYFGGSAAQAPINLGVNFPANTRNVDAYELVLFASPENGTVGWAVTRLNTGDVASGTLTAATAGVQLPLNTTLLSYHRAWRTNNATLLAVGLDIMSDYIETEN